MTRGIKAKRPTGSLCGHSSRIGEFAGVQASGRSVKPARPSLFGADQASSLPANDRFPDLHRPVPKRRDLRRSFSSETAYEIRGPGWSLYLEDTHANTELSF